MAKLKLTRLESKFQSKHHLKKTVQAFCEAVELAAPRNLDDFVDAIAAVPYLWPSCPEAIYVVEPNTPSNFEKQLPLVSKRDISRLVTFFNISPLVSPLLKELAEMELDMLSEISDGGSPDPKTVTRVLAFNRMAIRQGSERRRDDVTFPQDIDEYEKNLALAQSGYFTQHLVGRNYARLVLDRASQFHPVKSSTVWVNGVALTRIAKILFQYWDSNQPKGIRGNKKNRSITREKVYDLIRSFLEDVIVVCEDIEFGLSQKFVKGILLRGGQSLRVRTATKQLPQFLQTGRLV